MLTVGPFRITDIETIQNVLEKKQVPFEVYADEDLRDRLMAEHHSNASLNPRGTAGHLSLSYIFFEIDPAHFEKAKEELEKLGITAPTDGSYELAEEDPE